MTGFIPPSNVSTPSAALMFGGNRTKAYQAHNITLNPSELITLYPLGDTIEINDQRINLSTVQPHIVLEDAVSGKRLADLRLQSGQDAFETPVVQVTNIKRTERARAKGLLTPQYIQQREQREQRNIHVSA